MIVKNEQATLSQCLDSVKDMVDEMIIVDTGSVDSTREIALKFGAVVIDFEWVDHFAQARNVGLEQATGDWILVLDADEYIVNPEPNMLREIVNSSAFSNRDTIGTIEIQSRYLHDGIEMCSNDIISRLFPASLRYEGRIHEQIITHYYRKETGIIVKHEGYYKTDKSERNLKLLHKTLEESPGDAYYLFQIARQYRGCDRLDLAKRYIEQSYNGLKATDAFKNECVIEYLYILLDNNEIDGAIDIIQEQQTLLSNVPDYHLVCGLVYTRAGMLNSENANVYLPLIEQCYISCLALGKKNAREIVTGSSTFIAAYNLGAFYEVKGDRIRAIYNYKRSASYDYAPAIERLHLLSK